MDAHLLIPILNVSDITASFAWFERLGWKKAWDWGEPAIFGCVRSGHCQIFLAEGRQGGRGRGSVARTFGPHDEETSDRGVWMSIWVEDVDQLHAHCVREGFEITWPPTDMPWNVREMHIRHPDGHIFRMSQAMPEEGR